MTAAGRASVLGSPIHRAAKRELGLDDWSCDRFEVGEGALLSLTMPLKRVIIPLLDEITDTAVSVEAVNTFVLTEGGRRVGAKRQHPRHRLGPVRAGRRKS